MIYKLDISNSTFLHYLKTKNQQYSIHITWLYLLPKIKINHLLKASSSIFINLINLPTLLLGSGFLFLIGGFIISILLNTIFFFIFEPSRLLFTGLLLLLASVVPILEPSSFLTQHCICYFWWIQYSD